MLYVSIRYTKSDFRVLKKFSGRQCAHRPKKHAQENMKKVERSVGKKWGKNYLLFCGKKSPEKSEKNRCE